MDAGPVVVTFDHPQRHLGRRLRLAATSTAAWAMIVVATVALVVAVPTGFFVAGFVAARFQPDAPDAQPWPPPGMPVDEITIAWAASTVVAFGGLRLGLRLLRRGRSLVLFLRHFGFDDATDAVTFAAARSIGGRWRLVTLDDDEVRPLGVAPGVRRLLRAGGLASTTVSVLARAVGRAWTVAVTAVFAIGGLAVWRSGVTRGVDDGSLEPYIDVISTLGELRLPLAAIGPDLPGLFALFATAGAICFALGLVGFVGLLLTFPLAGVVGVVGSASSAARLAERAQTARILDVAQVSPAVATVAALAGKVLAPRLIVLRVATSAWREAVRQLGAIAAVALVDVSEPTEHLLWELQALEDRLGPRYVLVGQHDRVVALVDATRTSPPGTLVARIAPFLEGREILAYRADRRAIRRFARELRDRLLTVPTGGAVDAAW